jgi:hypothetical protein
MSLDVKALRALVDASKITPPVESMTDTAGTIVAYDVLRSEEWSAPRMWRPIGENVPERIAPLLVALLNAAPDLLTLAEAVREIGPILKVIADNRVSLIPDGTRHGVAVDDDERAAARRVLAILDTPPRAAGDGR